MKYLNRVLRSQKLQLGTLVLLCLVGGVACGGSGSSSTPGANPPTQPQGIVSGDSISPAQNQDVVPVSVAAVQQKSAEPRKGVCWNGRTQLKETNRQRLRNNANRSCAAVDFQRKVNLLLAVN